MTLVARRRVGVVPGVKTDSHRLLIKSDMVARLCTSDYRVRIYKRRDEASRGPPMLDRYEMIGRWRGVLPVLGGEQATVFNS